MRIMEIKIKNDVSGYGAKQLSLLPFLDIFWDENTYCIVIGWLMLSVEFWFGNIND